MHFGHLYSIWSPPRSEFENWFKKKFFCIFSVLEKPDTGQHLMPFSWHQEPLKDSSGLWNQPAMHRVQRFNKFQGSSQGTATLWTATQNQKPFKYLRRLIIDSLSGGILSSTIRKWAACTYLFIVLYTCHNLIMKKKTLLQFPQIFILSLQHFLYSCKHIYCWLMVNLWLPLSITDTTVAVKVQWSK